MSVNKLVVSESALEKTLQQFQGAPLDLKKLTDYHRIGFGPFANPSYALDPRIQFTAQLDINDIYENYKTHYKSSASVTFTTFVKWIVIKAMQHTPFTWRQINGNWYDFSNLPLLITMRTKKDRELSGFILENVAQSNWQTFCQYHDDFKEGKLKDIIHEQLELPVRYLGYQILNVHVPRMTSYNVTTKAVYAHQPFIVISDRYLLEKKLYLPFYVNYSHATLTPEDAEILLNQFQQYGMMKPTEVVHATRGIL